ncbi:sensor histidine kinase [Phycicoccus duodecadis]|uniref:histidine kinase n=1 Tax=Phycicoccus duodecadis TaxID=173053 RepID=A0A2N3YMF6_9MICO|nr:histidine kinase [Phycicoccus duodecadis]PKW27988.1 histidine kinase [Phycicoccus duodecadis]
MTRPLVVGAASTLVAGALAAATLTAAGEGMGPSMTAYVLVIVALALVPLAAGWFLLRHDPHHLVGGLLCFLAVSPLVVAAGDGWAAAVARHREVPVNDLLVALSQGSWMLLYVPAALLVLLFPDGRLVGPRWRCVLYGLLAVPVAWILLLAVQPERFPPPYTSSRHVLGALPASWAAVAEPLAVGLPLALLVLLMGAVAAPVVRHRHGDERVRRQVRAFTLGAAGLPVSLLLCWFSYLVLGVPDLVLVGLVITWLAIPGATVTAVVRHDLYGVDRALSATATYAVLSALALACATAVGVALGALLGQGHPVVSAAVAALSLLAVLPLRRPVTAVIDRVAYPRRHRLRQAVDDLARRVHQEGADPTGLESVLREALDDPSLRVFYSLTSDGSVVDRDGVVAPLPQDAVPLFTSGHTVAAYVTSTVVEPALLHEATRTASPLAELARARLLADLARRDAEASRARLQRAGYEERRRLERDLHDGAQQRLVSLGMSLRVAQRHLGRDSGGVDAVLDRAVAELGTAVAELRQLAHGIRPSCLDDGLAPALAGLTATAPLPILLDVDDIPLPDDIVATAYFVVVEAVTNAVKHSAAGRVVVRVRRQHEVLEVEVTDDGVGGADPGGSGLAGMADRVAAAAGAVTVVSPRGQGTSVRAVLPCAS